MQNGDYINSVLALTSTARVCFSWSGRDYPAAIALDAEVLARLRELETDPLRYGSLLFDTVFPAGSRPYVGFQTALIMARANRQRLRFRLKITTENPALHALFWELLYDTSQQLPIGCSPDTVLSRYAEIATEPGSAVACKPRLLCMIAAPRDCQRYGLSEIDYDLVKADFKTAIAANHDVFDLEFLDPPATLLHLRARLHESDYHLLHVLGHGVVHTDSGACLVLERSDRSADFVPEEQLQKTFLGDRDLRLVTLVACHGEAAFTKDSFSGLAGQLINHGLPAVIAFRREVKHSTAKLFTEHFYRELARTGRVDVAISEARQRLYLYKPEGLGWTSPVLYMRLADGLLWAPRILDSTGAVGEKSISTRPGAVPGKARLGLALVIVAVVSLVIWWEPEPVPTPIQEPPPATASSIEAAPIKAPPIIEPSPPPPPSPSPPVIRVEQWQKPPFIDAVFVYTKLPETAAVETRLWRGKIEAVLERELGSIGLELTRTNNARWLVIVEVETPILSPDELAGKTSGFCQIMASFRIYRERELAGTSSAFRERATKFDSNSACETAVQRVAARVGAAVVGAYSQ